VVERVSRHVHKCWSEIICVQRVARRIRQCHVAHYFFLGSFELTALTADFDDFLLELRGPVLFALLVSSKLPPRVTFEDFAIKSVSLSDRRGVRFGRKHERYPSIEFSL
jgi:hypothetical protein